MTQQSGGQTARSPLWAAKIGVWADKVRSWVSLEIICTERGVKRVGGTESYSQREKRMESPKARRIVSELMSTR